MVAWASRLFVRSRRFFIGLSLHSPWKKWKWLGHTHTETPLTSRTRCVWGNTVVPELPSPPQRARPFHSHAIQTQASPPFEGRHPFHHLGLLGGTSVPAFLHYRLDVLTACSADSLVPTSLSVTDTGVTWLISLSQGS